MARKHTGAIAQSELLFKSENYSKVSSIVSKITYARHVAVPIVSGLHYFISALVHEKPESEVTYYQFD